MSRISIIKIVLCFLIIIINGCLPAISAENLPLESAHPYANNFNKTWTVSEPGAARIRLHFEYLNLAKPDNPFLGYDSLILLDKYGNQLRAYESYDGINEKNYWTDWYEGDTLKVRLVTDGTGVGDGFVIDKTGIKQDGSITHITNDSPVESDHPYQNNYVDVWSISEPGATKLRLHFKYLKLAKSDNEFLGYDELVLYDKYDNKLENYVNYDDGFDKKDFWTDWYPGDTLQVKLSTDNTRVCDGFVIDKMEGSNETNSSSESTIDNSKNVVPESHSEGAGTGENKVLTATTLTSSANLSTLGQSIKLTAKVDAPSEEAKDPSGTISFMDGTTAIGTADLTSGQATLITSTLSGGSHSITAEYRGDENFEPSTSSSVPLIVQADDSNPSVHSNYTFIYNHIDSILTTIAAIIGLITAIYSKKQGRVNQLKRFLMNSLKFISKRKI